MKQIKTKHISDMLTHKCLLIDSRLPPWRTRQKETIKGGLNRNRYCHPHSYCLLSPCNAPVKNWRSNGLTPGNNSPYRKHVLKIEIQKEILSSMKISRGVIQLKLCQRPVNVDHMIFSLILAVIFWICAEANIVPLNLKRNDFHVACGMQFVNEFILINYN